jgi:hypothetical protein
MGNARFLFGNLITSEAMITATSERPGLVGLAVKVGTGSAAMQAAGPYTGLGAAQYVVEVNDLSAGSGVGQAKYRWRRAVEAGWVGTGLTTSAAPALLENGITVSWASGGGTDFASGDYWTVTCDKPFGRRSLIDADRNTEWRSADYATAQSLVVDLGATRTVDAVAFLDTNLRVGQPSVAVLAGATLAQMWAGQYVGYVASGPNGVLYTGGQAYRYWCVYPYDIGNPDGYLRVGSLYVGAYMAFARNYRRGFSRTRSAAIYGPTGTLRAPRGVYAVTDTLSWQYSVMADADRLLALGMFDAIYNQDVGVVRPVIVNPDSDTPADVSAYDFQSPELELSQQSLALYEWKLTLAQRPRLARSGA